MAKLTRVPAKVFAASAAADEIGQFGSAVAGSKLETADVATIQGLSAWLDGWSEALVSGNRYPALQEMNGLLKVLSYQGAYALQEGIPEYDANTSYYIGSIVKKTGTFELYGSLTDDNVGNALTVGASWQFLGDLRALYQVPANTTIYVATTGSDTTGDGSSANPFATPHKAFEYLNGKILLGTVTIQLADGTYNFTETLTINPLLGYSVILNGNISDKSLVKIVTSSITAIINNARGLTISNLTLDGTTTGGDSSGILDQGNVNINNCIVKHFVFNIYCLEGAHTVVSNVTTTLGTHGIVSGRQGACEIDNAISTYNENGISASQQGNIRVKENCTITYNTTGVFCLDGSSIQFNDSDTTLLIRYNTTYQIRSVANSIVNLNGSSYTGAISPAINTEGNYGSWILS